MKNILASLLATTLSVASFATTVNYTADNSTNFTNPERGFYEQVEQKVTNSTSSNLNDYYFTQAEAAGRSLILRLYYLDYFRTQTLPDNLLTLITNDMAVFRAKGVKCILRFAYTNSQSKPYQDASPAIWQQHLSQLKPVLQANADVIYVVQAGFLGVWGEWYYSSQGTGDEIPQSVRTQLITQLLDAVPASRCVQLRTPKYKTDYLGHNNPLTEATAWQQNEYSRLGHHNDAFCNGAENMGTYQNPTTDKAYIAQECLFVPNGGENNIEEADAYNNYGTGAKALAEMKLLHYSYLNYDYSQYATSRWKTEKDASGNAYYDLMARHMGYRFQLLQGTFPEEVGSDRTMAVKLTIKNVGFAPLYNERHAYIVLKSAANTYTIPLQSNPRTWMPEQTATIQETLTLPADIPNGTYSLYLYLPDADSRLAANPKFAVRCANTNIWDATTGYNNLNASLQITNEVAPDPEPEPTPEPTPDDPAGCRVDTIIRLTITGQTTCSVSGSIGGTGSVNILGSSAPYKLNKDGAYVTMQLNDGNFFQEGDTLAVDMAFNQTTFYAYTDNGVTELLSVKVSKSNDVLHAKFVLPAAVNNKNQIWICRTSANGQNGRLNGMEVYRKVCSGTTPDPVDPIDPVETVTVTYSDNQPTAWNDNFLFTPSGNTAATINKGTNYTIPTSTPSIGEKTEPDYLIYYFKGWNTKQDGTGITYQANEVIPSVNTNITLYAQWEGRPFSITYYADQAKTELLNLMPVSYTFDTEVIFPAPTRIGYDFVAWHSVWDNSTVTSTKGYYGDFQLYAEWKASTSTELTNLQADTDNTRKYIKNGTLFIQRNNITYTVLGTQLTK